MGSLLRCLLAFSLLLFSVGSRVEAQCVEGTQAFGAGEVLDYAAYYNWGFVWVKAGVAKFSVAEENGNYKFTVVADNLPKWEWLYSLHSRHTASVTKDFKPLYMQASTSENGVVTKDYYRYDGDFIYKTYSSRKDTLVRTKVIEHPACSWDIINAVYVARSMDVRNRKEKSKIPFHVIFNDSVYTIYGSVLGREKIETRTGKEYDCLKCTATVVEGTMFEAGVPVYVWITNDVRQIPVLVESKIKVGSVKVYLE